MRDNLLKFICCPICKADLILTQAEICTEEIKSGTLSCSRCRKTYPVTDFVPRFIASDKYVGNFSFEWLLYKRTQLDSATGFSESKDTFIEKTGIEPEQLKNKLILDVGCGTGRYMEVVTEYAAEIIGVDLSYAIEAARENLGHKKNAHIIQADIFDLPFRAQTFDFVYSIGVLHHTPDTKKAFEQLIPLVKKNGTISIWVYSNETRYEQIRNKFTDFYRHFTVYLPPKWLWYLCHLAVPLYTLKKVKKIRTILDLILPTSNHPNMDWRILDTFDWYSPKYQFKHTYIEVENWFREAGLTDIQRLSFPVAVKGEKRE